MGTWGTGLFDNDRALDAMRAAAAWIVRRLGALAEARATEPGAHELAATLGLLLQFDADAVGCGHHDDDIRAATRAQRAALPHLCDTTRALVEQLACGAHETLAERYMRCSPELVRATGRRLVSLHDPALFASPQSAAVACGFADHLATLVDVEFTAALPDLYHLDAPAALLGMLLLVSPRALDDGRLARVLRHRAKLAQAVAREADEPGPDDEFWTTWVGHVEAAFELLEATPRVA